LVSQKIYSRIFLELARIYQDPLRRNQYKKFTFDPAEEQLARDILTRLERNFIIEELQPNTVRLTDFGYEIIQHDLPRLRAIADVPNPETEERQEDYHPPLSDVMELIADEKEAPDYISVSGLRNGHLETLWATDGFRRVTGFTKEELNAAGGTFFLVRTTANHKMLYKFVKSILFNGFVDEEIDILTKDDNKRRIRFISKLRYDIGVNKIGTLNAVWDITSRPGLKKNRENEAKQHADK
jgi:hypothetical protein